MWRPNIQIGVSVVIVVTALISITLFLKPQTKPFAEVSSSPPPIIDNFKYWRTDESQTVSFSSQSISAKFSKRIDLNFQLSYFDFVNDNEGFGVGTSWKHGQLPIFFRTEDGGQNWSIEPLAIGSNPTGIAFRNNQEGLITTFENSGCPPPNCLNKAFTLNTKDGGQSWELVEHKDLRGRLSNLRTDSKGNYYAAFTVYEHLFFANQSPPSIRSSTPSVKLVKSIDAGMNWVTISDLGNTLLESQDLQLVHDTLYVRIDSSTIAKFDTSGNLIGRLRPKSGRIWQFIPVSDTAVFATVINGSSVTLLVRTVDEGRSWDVIRRDWKALIAARSPDEVVGVIPKGRHRHPSPVDGYGGVSTIAYTDNGGETWAESEMLDSLYPFALWHSSASNLDLVLLQDRVLTVTTLPNGS